jgi:glycosyltransferase involved in cell wall biosynthesis
MVKGASGPLVTVVIPTWNRKALLGEAIASVAGQTYRNWELIVADDGSSDGTADALRASGEPRLRVVALDHQGSIARARNAGAAAGSGALIAFLDSDDLWLPRKLELQVAALCAGPARWCYGNYAHIDPGGEPLPGRPVAFRAENGRIVRQMLLDETAVTICTMLLERDLFDALGGFDETMRLRDDFDFGLRLAAAADAVAVPEAVALVRVHPARTTLAVDDPHEASAAVFDRFLARETDKDLRRIARARRSRLLVDGGFRRLARRDIFKGARLLVAAVAGGAALAYLARRTAAGVRNRLGRSRAPRRGA